MKTRSTTVTSCPGWHQALLDALEGRLGPQPRELLAEHLARCPACARELESLRATLRTLDEYQVEELDETYWQGLRARVRTALDEEPTPRWRALLAPRPAQAWSAGAALLLLIVALGWQLGRGPSSTDWLAQMEASSRSELRAGLQLDAGTVEAVLDEEWALTTEDDADLMLEDLTAAELNALYTRLEGLNG